jgi:hypothetical protein
MKPTEKTKEVLTIEQRIKKVEVEVQQAQEQLNEWNAVLLKKLGALEVLEQMLKE